MEIRIEKRKAVRGLQIFLILTVLGIAAIFYLMGSRETWTVLRGFRLSWLALACGLVVVDLFAGAARIHVFTSRIAPRAFNGCFQANLANIFLAAATPFQTGGGLAQLYVLRRHGIPYPAGAGVSVMNFVATLSFLFVIALIVLQIAPDRFASRSAVFAVLGFTRIAFYITFGGFLLFLVRPGPFGRAMAFALERLARVLPARSGLLRQWSAGVTQFFADYRRHLGIWRGRVWPQVWNAVLTVVLYGNKCLIAWVVLRGLNVAAPLGDVVLLQALIVFLLYFAPTPGASFIAEAGISAIMSLLMPVHVIPLFAILWRFFTTYFGVFVGAIVLLRILGAVERAPGRARGEAVV